MAVQVVRLRRLAGGARNGAAALRLLCLPHAGGGANAFHAWRPALPPGFDLWSISLPGREDRLDEPPAADLAPLVTALTDALAASDAGWRDTPFALVGHSFGALLAFELARALRDRGGPMPRLVAVSGFRAPHLPARRPPLHDLPREAFRAELGRLQGTPPELLADEAMMELIEPALRADLACCACYRHAEAPPLRAPLSVFGGLSDPLVPRPDLAAWRRHAAGPFRLRLFAGGHFLPPAQRSLMLRHLAADLESAVAPPHG